MLAGVVIVVSAEGSLGVVVLKEFVTEAAAEATAAENLSSAVESPRVKNLPPPLATRAAAGCDLIAKTSLFSSMLLEAAEAIVHF